MPRILYDINMDGILWSFGVLKSIKLKFKDTWKAGAKDLFEMNLALLFEDTNISH